MAFRKFDVAESSPIDALKDKEGVVKHELITYKLKDGKFIKSLCVLCTLTPHEDSQVSLFFPTPRRTEETKGTKNSKYLENSLTTSNL